MKQLNQKDTSQAKYYRQLKPLYKLLLKSDDELNYTTFKKQQNFQWRYLTENEVVDRLPSISYEFKMAKQFIKSCLAIITRNSQLLRETTKEVPSKLHYLKKPFSDMKKAFNQHFRKSILIQNQRIFAHISKHLNDLLMDFAILPICACGFF